MELPQEREKHAAHGVAKRNDEDARNRAAAPRARHPEVEHIRDAVLGAAEGKRYHA